MSPQCRRDRSRFLPAGVVELAGTPPRSEPLSIAYQVSVARRRSLDAPSPSGRRATRGTGPVATAIPSAHTLFPDLGTWSSS